MAKKIVWIHSGPPRSGTMFFSNLASYFGWFTEHEPRPKIIDHYHIRTVHPNNRHPKIEQLIQFYWDTYINPIQEEKIMLSSWQFAPALYHLIDFLRKKDVDIQLSLVFRDARSQALSNKFYVDMTVGTNTNASALVSHWLEFHFALNKHLEKLKNENFKFYMFMFNKLFNDNSYIPQLIKLLRIEDTKNNRDLILKLLKEKVNASLWVDGVDVSIDKMRQEKIDIFTKKFNDYEKLME